MSQVNDFLDGKPQPSEIDSFLGPDTPKPAGALRKGIADKAIGFASGAIGATKALTDVAGAGNFASKALGSLNEGVNDYLSLEAKADQQEQTQILKDAEGKGTWEGVKAGARAFGVAPVQTAIQGLGSVVPILAGGALAGGSRLAAAGIGAGMGAGTIKGTVYDEIKQRNLDAGATPEVAESRAQQAQGYGNGNTGQIALGAALGTADALTGVAGSAQRMLAGAAGKPIKQAIIDATEKTVLQRAALGAVGEFPLEAAQGGQEQVAANLAAQRAGFEAGTFDNVASNATLEGLASAGPGAAFGVMERAKPRPEQPPPPEPEQPVADPSATLALPAPSIIVGPDGTATTAQDRNARLSRIASGDVTDVTPIAERPVQTPAESMGLNPAAGPLSAAAVTAVDTGAHQAISLEQISQSDQSAYDAYMAEQDTSSQPITTGKIAEAAMSAEDRHAVLFSNQSVADGGIRYEGTQDGDVLNGMGAPFSTPLAARRRANMEGKDWTIAPVFDGYVARRKDAIKDTNASNPNGVQPLPATSIPTGSDNGAAGVGTRNADGVRNGSDAETLASGDLGQSSQPANGPTQPSIAQPTGEKSEPKADQTQQSQSTQTPEQAAEPVTQSAQPRADSQQDKSLREWQDNYDRISNTDDLSTVLDKDLIRADAYAARFVASESRKGWDGGEVNQSYISALQSEQSRIKTEIKRRSAQSAAIVDQGAGVSQPTQVAPTAANQKAIDRIAKGTAYFGNAIKAGKFIADNGLKDTHEVKMSKPGRFDIVAKSSESKAAPAQETRAPIAINSVAQEAASKPTQADSGQGLHFANGVGDFKAGKPRTLPTYFTKPSEKNAKDWYRGWDSANAAAPVKESNTPRSESQAVNDFVDGKRDTAPTLDEVKAELSPLTQAMNNLMETRSQIAAQGRVVDDRLAQRERQQAAIVKELEGKPAESPADAAPAAIKNVAPAVSANTVFTESAADAARARLKAKLNRLNSGIDPELMLDGIVLAGYHIEKGARTFAAYAKAMVDDLGDGVKPYLKSWYVAVSMDPRAEAFSEGMDEPGDVKKADIEALTAPQKKQGPTLTESLAADIARGNMPKDNPALKKLVEAFDGKPADPARMKDAQEALEAAIVQLSRTIVAKNEGPRSTFDALLRVYESQPNLNVRTSTSIANQAYSTPAPLAYIGSALAGVNATTTLYEPTGGNGMLTIAAAPSNVTVNELEPGRIAALKAQGFKQVLEGDALQADVAPKSQDRVMTNPPFGSVKDSTGKPIKVEIDGYKLGQIDHLIAARALDTMKDNGSATLIIGANKITGGLSTDDRIFFNWLYGRYNVTSHFEVSGDLYTRQGAQWPVRVITINGRQESKRVSPLEGTITRADNWEQVYEQFTASLDSAGAAGTSASTGAGSIGTPKTGRADVSGSTGSPATGRGGQGQGGSTPSAGAVRAPAGAVPDSVPRANEQLGGDSGSVRLNADPIESDRLDPAGDSVIKAPKQSAGSAGADTSLKTGENQFQITYTPRSSRKDGGVLIPVNMAQPTQDALSKLEDAVGDIDQYAAKELGYDSVEQMHQGLMGLQVDSVASAIYQISQGKGVIIADQTGIGKGRQAAAVIRWAERSGFTPVFVSVKPSLFTDMYGDLHDIGSDNIKPFILNKDDSIKGPSGEKLFANKALTHKRTMEQIRDSGQLPAGSNALFMTYSQINTENVQRGALIALANNAVFILDESHNAGGASNTGEFMTSLLESAKGVTYLSATYAKRPDNMPLYFKTDIGQAAADNEGLMTAMAAGGLPLQTVVSNNLVQAGQMFRRERSYDGVSIESVADSENRIEHEKLSDTTTLALRAIVAADSMFHGVFVKQMQKDAKAEGAAIQDNAGNQATAGVDHTQFSSVVHNFVKQMLLGLKAQSAADKAIASLKRGEKPLIAVENTMGSFLKDYAADNMIAIGGDLGSFDYRTVLSRALARTLVVNVVSPTGQKSKREIKLSELDAETRAAYDNAQAVIDSLKLNIPVSPLDWMRNEITKAGFTVAEITGRNLAVDYSNKAKPILTKIDQTEQDDKVRTTQLFNSGALDAIILNVAGSTGISLHASEKFKDQRQRHMIVAQAAGDINIFMQMLGRVHRTGQVKLPKYTILSVDLPTEKRPTAVLSGKMKSLNANTSSNTDSATSIKTMDMFNKYGDQVVAQYLQDNYELARDLGVEDLIGGDDAADDLARKATGRLALQPITRQNAVYEEIEAQYAALIEYLNKTNQNDLEPRTFDFDASATREELLFEGPDKSTPFGDDAIYGEYSIKAQGKAMSPTEIRAEMESNLEGKTSSAHITSLATTLDSQHQAYVQKLANEAKATGNESGKQVESAIAARQIGKEFVLSHAIGKTFRVDINGESYNAVVTNIRSTHKTAGNPYSLSKIQVTVALNGALRNVTVPATQFGKIQVSGISSGYTVEQLFKEQPANQRETAKIVTGNLLAAYGEIQGARGTIISFTKQDGTVAQGILLPKAFDFTSNTRGDYRLATGADALKFLQKSQHADIGRFGIMSRDGVVRILPVGQGIDVVVPKSKLKGGKYFLDKGLIGVLGDFTSSGSSMRARTYEPKAAIEALDLLLKKNALYALPSMAEEAKELTGGSTPAASRVKFSRGAQGQATQAVENKVAELTANWENKPKIVVAFDMDDERIPERVRAEDQKQRSGGATGTPEGFYYKGTVYLMSSKLATDKDVARVLFHESLGHYGLRGLYGKSLKQVLSKVAVFRKNEVAKKMEQYGLKGINSLDRMTAAEEVLAEMAQNTPTIGFVREAIAAIRTWLRDNVPGLDSLSMTDDEIIRSYIIPARNFVERANTQSTPAAVPVFSRSARALQTDTAAFKKWFGESKVVDADGNPLVVYHGTGYSIKKFTSYRGDLIYFARGADTAESFADAADENIREQGNYEDEIGAASEDGGAAIYPVYLSVQTPFDPDNPDHLAKLSKGAARDVGRGGNFDDVERHQREIKNAGFDGVYVRERGHEEAADRDIAVFSPAQIKSATGNNGDFDGANPDIRFSRSAILQQVGDKLNETLTHTGTVSGWWKSVGSMYGLAQKSPEFKRVFDAAQGFLDDVSYYATEAADMAPKILPKLEHWRDIGKSPISYVDNKAIAAPIFEGTLGWARDENGKPIRIEDKVKAAAGLSIDQKAQRLLREYKISEGVLKMWRGLPIDQYESIIESSYEKHMLRPGVVWSDKELVSMFKLAPAQIGLYKEFRRSVDSSIDNAAKAGMLRTAGKDAAMLKDMVMDAPTADAAGILLRDHLLQMAEGDSERSAALIDMANAMMDQADKATKLKAEGYAPLSRFGQYSVDVVVNGERQEFRMFEDKRSSNQFAAQMRGKYGAANVSQSTMSQKEFEQFQGITPETMELFGNMLGLDSTGSDASDQVFQKYLKMTKANRSAMKRLIHRKGVAGYSEDVGRVLASFVYSNARHTAGALNLGEMGEAVNDIPKGQGELKDVAIGLQQYVTQPQEEAQAIRGMMFAQYIGGSVASALVNLTQPIQISFPYLSQFGGVKQSAAQLTQAYKDMAKKGFQYDAKLASALKIAEERGIVAPQAVHQLMAQARGVATLNGGDGTRTGDFLAKSGNALTKLMMGWGKLFGMAEQVNRRATFIAAYRIAQSQKMADPAGFAAQAVNETQFINNRGNKMRWGRGAVGATLMTFKSYSFNYLELLHRMSTKNGKEGKQAAMLMMGVLLLMAGAGGLPFADDLDDLIDFLGEKLGYNFSSKKAKQQFLEELFGQAGADFAMRGITGLPGSPIDISGRMSMGNMLPGTGLLLEKRDHARDLQEIIGPVGDMATRAGQAAGLVLDGDIAKAAMTIAPKAVSNAYQGGDMLDKGYYADRKGYKVIDTTTGEGISKLIGFQPQSVARVQESNAITQRMKDIYSLKAQDIRARWAKGLFEKDAEQVQQAKDMIADWNAKNPEQRMMIDLPSVWKRAREMAKPKDQRIAETAPKAMREQLKRELVVARP